MGITRSVKFTVNSTSREGDIRSLTYFDNVRERMALPEEEGEDGDRGDETNLPSASPCPLSSSSLHLVKAASYGVFAAVTGC